MNKTIYGVSTIETEGNIYALVAGGTERLLIINVSNPLEPRVVNFDMLTKMDAREVSSM